MKKLIMVLLLLVSTNVFAVNWINAGTGSDGKFTHYVDSQSIQRAGNKIIVWALYDYKSVQVFKKAKKRYLSNIGRAEYNCSEATVRTLDAYWYAGNMAGGDVILALPNLTDPAVPIVPGSTAEAKLKVLCPIK